jgi:LysR family transcriptional regulator, transcriptional activator of the cysJI operon
MLDIQLQIFKTVVEKESFSLAAQELHMTQSSVSQQIRALETYFGAKLFDRLHRRIFVTEAGNALYPYAVSLERLYQEARDTMSGQRELVTGHLSVSASLTIGEYLLPKLLVQFNTLYPQVHIEMSIENTERVIGKIVDGTAGVGFVEGLYKPVPTLEETCCRGDDLVIIAPASSATTSCAPVPLVGLINEKWVLREPDSGTRRVFENFLAKNGCIPSTLNVIMELSSTEAIKNAVMAGVGLGVMSRLAVLNELKRGELKVTTLREGTIDRRFRMLRNKGKFQTKAVEKFCAFFLEQIQADSKLSGKY